MRPRNTLRDSRTAPQPAETRPAPSAPEVDPAIAVRGLAVRFGSHRVLADVDLDLARGEITALVGPSGVGKSTLLFALTRLVEQEAGCRLSGSVRLDGEEVLAPGVDLVALRRRVGTIFQRPNPFPLSIRRNLELPLREHGVHGRRHRAERARAALERVGLWNEVAGRLRHSATRLSGGQQQRLCLARALALDPEVLLLDEPTSSLDPRAAAVVEDAIASLAGRVTVLLVTHDLAQARRLATRAALLWPAGQGASVIDAGPAETLLSHPSHPITAGYVRGAGR